MRIGSDEVGVFSKVGGKTWIRDQSSQFLGIDERALNDDGDEVR